MKYVLCIYQQQTAPGTEFRPYQRHLLTVKLVVDGKAYSSFSAAGSFMGPRQQLESLLDKIGADGFTRERWHFVEMPPVKITGGYYTQETRRNEKADKQYKDLITVGPGLKAPRLTHT